MLTRTGLACYVRGNLNKAHRMRAVRIFSGLLVPLAASAAARWPREPSNRVPNRRISSDRAAASATRRGRAVVSQHGCAASDAAAGAPADVGDASQHHAARRHDARRSPRPRAHSAASMRRARRNTISPTSAYTLDGADARTRPVTSCSTAVRRRVGLAATWRDRAVAAADVRRRERSLGAPVVAPNAETWLRFTDLVFFDPVGTGFSRLRLPERGPAQASLVRRRRRRRDRRRDPPLGGAAGRAVSPKYVVGESYGGIRGPRVVEALQTSRASAWPGSSWSRPRSISPAAARRSTRSTGRSRLPTMAAIARAATAPPERPVDRAALADVESLRRSATICAISCAATPIATRSHGWWISVTTLTGSIHRIVRDRGGRVDNDDIHPRTAPRARARWSAIMTAPWASPIRFPIRCSAITTIGNRLAVRAGDERDARSATAAS